MLIFGYFLLAGIITALVTPLIIRLYKKMHWDKAHANKIQTFKDTHQKNVPRGGGLAIFIGLLCTLSFLWPWNFTLQMILLGAFLLTAIGVLDDIFDLNPFLRLLVNLAAAACVIYAGITIDFVTNPFASGVLHLDYWWWLPSLITLVYLTFLINITNWAKGVDGQMPGTVAIAAIFIGFLSFRLTSHQVEMTSILSFITAGAFTGFLFWNFYPQRIMPGYGGGALGGFLLGVLSILSGAKLATLFMVMALPIADAIFTIMRRILAGKSPFWGDRGHLHHKLLDQFGWGRRRIAIFYWLVTLVMGILALILPTWGKIVAFIAVLILTFVFLIRAKILSLRKN
ncbi:MAG: MraY family glycosyltransferase [bacterium]|nr:MraY family glycosyltransferase [bacterium]